MQKLCRQRKLLFLLINLINSLFYKLFLSKKWKKNSRIFRKYCQINELLYYFLNLKWTSSKETINRRTPAIFLFSAASATQCHWVSAKIRSLLSKSWIAGATRIWMGSTPSANCFSFIIIYFYLPKSSMEHLVFGSDTAHPPVYYYLH